MTYVQILALEIVEGIDGCAIEPVAFRDAEIFGVYLGVPGGFAWHADFDTYEKAAAEAKYLVADGYADEVLDHSRKYGE